MQLQISSRSLLSWHTRVELRAFCIKNEPFVVKCHLYMALDYESGWSKEERTLTEMIGHSNLWQSRQQSILIGGTGTRFTPIRSIKWCRQLNRTAVRNLILYSSNNRYVSCSREMTGGVRFVTVTEKALQHATVFTRQRRAFF